MGEVVRNRRRGLCAPVPDRPAWLVQHDIVHTREPERFTVNPDPDYRAAVAAVIEPVLGVLRNRRRGPVVIIETDPATDAVAATMLQRTLKLIEEKDGRPPVWHSVTPAMVGGIPPKRGPGRPRKVR